MDLSKSQATTRAARMEPLESHGCVCTDETHGSTWQLGMETDGRVPRSHVGMHLIDVSYWYCKCSWKEAKSPLLGCMNGVSLHTFNIINTPELQV